MQIRYEPSGVITTSCDRSGSVVIQDPYRVDRSATIGKDKISSPNTNWKSRIDEHEFVSSAYTVYDTHPTANTVSEHVKVSDTYPVYDPNIQDNIFVTDNAYCNINGCGNIDAAYGMLNENFVDGPRVRGDGMSEAWTSALAGAYTGGSDLLASILEARETARMIGTRVEKANLLLKKAIRSIKTKKFKRFVARSFKNLGKVDIDDVCNAWLEARYGWRPLIYDITGMMESYHDTLTHVDNLLYNEKGFRRLPFPGVPSDEMHLHGQWSAFGDFHIYGKPSVLAFSGFAVARAYYKVNTEVEDAQWLAAFGFSSPLSSLWNVLPFSFVADRFANFGDWVAANTSLPFFVNIVGGYSAQKYTSTWGHTVDRVGHQWGESSLSGVSYWTTESYHRRLESTNSTEIKFDVNLDTLFLADLFAIARGQAHRMRREAAKTILI